MIDFGRLSVQDRKLLASSSFGHLPARQIPPDWKYRIEHGYGPSPTTIFGEPKLHTSPEQNGEGFEDGLLMGFP